MKPTTKAHNAYTLSDIKRQFDQKYYQRGKKYQQKKFVLALHTQSNGDITGTVLGNRLNKYDVVIKLSQDSDGVELDGFCDCPIGYNCKHVVAVLLEQLNLLHTHTPVTPQEPRHITTENTLAEDDFDQWMDQNKIASSQSATHNNRLIIYILQLEKTPKRLSGHSKQPSLTVYLYSTRILKNGGYGKLQTISAYTNNYTEKSYLTQDDIDIYENLSWLAQQQNTQYNHYSQSQQMKFFLQGGTGKDILTNLIKTQRCFWHDQNSPALTLGKNKPIHFHWQLLNNGSQRFVYQLAEHLLLLPFEPFWYLDTNTYQCAPLQYEQPTQQLSTLLNMPDIPLTRLEKVYQTLVNTVPTLLPLSLSPITKKNKVTPTPYLKLMITSVSVNTGDHYYPTYHDLSIPTIELGFYYSKEKILWSEQAVNVYHKNEDDNLIAIPRQFSQEEKFIHAILGLKTINQLANLDVECNTSYMQALFAFSIEEHPPQLHNFIHKQIPLLEKKNWKIEFADDFPFRYVNEDEVEWFSDVEESDYDWFTISLGIKISGETISLLPLLVNLIRITSPQELKNLPSKEKINITLPDGRLLAIPVERIRTILTVLTELYDTLPNSNLETLKLSTLRATQLLELEKALGSAKLRWLGSERLKNLAEKFSHFKEIESVAIPQGFKAKLRPYQQRGVDWLQFLKEYGLAGILADDMGLGKTVQTLANLWIEKVKYKPQKPSLIVAPTSLMVNWRMEAQRFTPDLNVLVLHGTERKQHFDKITDYDVVLTTYPLLRHDKEQLLATDYHYLILDEAQCIKNAKAQATQIVQQLKAQHRLCLTGTPMENNLSELWSLFNFLMPGLLGNNTQFKRLYRTPIERHQDDERQKILAKRIKPFMLRRTKTAVLKDLPAKTEIICNVELDGKQRDLYESIRLAMHEKVANEIKHKGFSRSHIMILDALLKLRQTCCDPRLLKLTAAKKAHGVSAKLDLLMDLLPSLIAEGRRILLFSQFTSMLALIEEQLKKAHIEYVQLTGKTRDRSTPIETFQAGKVPLFLISLKAGGTGLNLTAADTVIHYDPWWNPAVETQATDRAHRIGQKKKVFVYKLITSGTVEETILKMQQKKKGLIDGLFSASQQNKSTLSANDLQQLFQPL
ncbi:MAG: DEAD/DEAH box helicase [Gammaproteobacteria bacterium]|nr:DEAD/DEAH box helicase [Gammaproteobacteria bacterium]